MTSPACLSTHSGHRDLPAAWRPPERAFPPTRPASWTLPGVPIYGDLKLRAGGAPVGLGSSQDHGGSGWGVGCAWGSPLPAVVRVRAPGGAAGTWRRFPARPGAFSFPPLLPPSAPAFWGGGRGSRARGGGGGTQAANPLHQPLISRAPRGSEAIALLRQPPLCLSTPSYGHRRPATGGASTQGVSTDTQRCRVAHRWCW